MTWVGKNTVPFSERSPAKETALAGVTPACEPAECAVRRAWNRDACRHCQEFTACFLPGGAIPSDERIATFLRTMPPPRGAGEEVLLQSILGRLAFSIWTSAVLVATPESQRADRRSRHAFARSRAIPTGWDAATMAEWTAVFRDVIAQAWPRWAALRASALLNDRPGEAWTLGRLAAEVGCRPAQLDAEFRRQFGIPPREYLTRLRVRAAIDLLTRGLKVESVPSAVGYGSRKDLDRALARLTGLHPSQVSHLTSGQIASVHQRLSIAASTALLPSVPMTM